MDYNITSKTLVAEFACFAQSSSVKKAGVYKTAHLLRKLNADLIFRGFVVQSITSILLMHSPNATLKKG